MADTVVKYKITHEDKVNAVWRAFKRAVEDNPTADIIFPMIYRRAARSGLQPRSWTLIRWHHFLRPWLYPDPNPFPRINLLKDHSHV